MYLDICSLLKRLWSALFSLKL